MRKVVCGDTFLSHPYGGGRRRKGSVISCNHFERRGGKGGGTFLSHSYLPFPSLRGEGKEAGAHSFFFFNHREGKEEKGGNDDTACGNRPCYEKKKGGKGEVAVSIAPGKRRDAERLEPGREGGRRKGRGELASRHPAH